MDGVYWISSFYWESWEKLKISEIFFNIFLTKFLIKRMFVNFTLFLKTVFKFQYRNWYYIILNWTSLTVSFSNAMIHIFQISNKNVLFSCGKERRDEYRWSGIYTTIPGPKSHLFNFFTHSAIIPQTKWSKRINIQRTLSCSSELYWYHVTLNYFNWITLIRRSR